MIRRVLITTACASLCLALAACDGGSSSSSTGGGSKRGETRQPPAQPTKPPGSDIGSIGDGGAKPPDTGGVRPGGRGGTNTTGG